MNTFTNPTWVVNETGFRFSNSVKGAPNLNRTYDSKFRQSGAKVGDTVSARLPQRYTIRSGQAYQAQALNDRTMPVSLKYQHGVDFDYSTAQETMEVDRVKERYINPAADRLANEVDVRTMADLYASVYWAVGTPGVTPNTNIQYLNAGVKLDDFACSSMGRIAVLDQAHMAAIVNANLTLFNPSQAISQKYRTGQFGNDALGIDDWYKDQNMPTHTTGSFTAASPTVNGANQTGSTLNTQAWASGATVLEEGDVFTIAGVYSWNPANGSSNGRLQDFVVTARSTDTTGNITALPISPPIITSGALQTVSNSPASGAAISVWGVAAGGALSATVSKQSMVFHPDFAAFVMADLVEPFGNAEFAFVRSKDWNLSIRFIKDYIIEGDQNASRLDILHGNGLIEPGFAVRMVG